MDYNIPLNESGLLDWLENEFEAARIEISPNITDLCFDIDDLMNAGRLEMVMDCLKQNGYRCKTFAPNIKDFPDKLYLKVFNR